MPLFYWRANSRRPKIIIFLIYLELIKSLSRKVIQLPHNFTVTLPTTNFFESLPMKISIFSSIYLILQNMGRKKEICIYDRTYLTRGKMAARRKETIPFCVHTNDAFLLYWYPFVKPATSSHMIQYRVQGGHEALTSNDIVIHNTAG